jgi:hypothetical protein
LARASAPALPGAQPARRREQRVEHLVGQSPPERKTASASKTIKYNVRDRERPISSLIPSRSGRPDSPGPP